MLQSIRKLSGLLEARDRKRFGLLCVLLIGNALLEMVGVGIIPAFVTFLAYPEKLQELALFRTLNPVAEVPTRQQILIVGSVAITIVFMLKAAYTFGVSYAKARFSEGRVKQFGKRLFQGYLTAPYEFHLGRNSSELLRNLNQECTMIGNMVLVPLMDLITNGLIGAAIIILLLTQLAPVAIGWMLVFILVAAMSVGALQRRVKALGIEARLRRKEMIRNVSEGLGGVKEIRVIGRERYFVHRFSESLARTTYIQRYIQVLNKSTPGLLELLSVIGMLGLLLVMALSDIADDALISMLVLFSVALVRLKTVAVGVAASLSQLRHNLVSVDVLADEFAELRRRAEPAGELPVDSAESGKLRLTEMLAFKNVSYCYEGRQTPALSELTFQIRAGEAIGVVGSTGAGKSTLIDVLLGVLRPGAGQILVDGVDIQTRLREWQSNIGYVPQHIYLVDGTIRQNIALGLPDGKVDDDLIEASMAAAHLTDFIKSLPDGVQTVVGERGVRLSGGQRQRIGIARALYKNPDVLVLDEATSALDNATERSVMAAVEDLKGQRTIIMIAHRLSTVAKCDMILFMEAGKVTGSGSYKTLLSSHDGLRRLTEGTQS